MQAVISNKCKALYQIFRLAAKQGTLNNLFQAEALLTAFNVDVTKRNTITLRDPLGKTEVVLQEYQLPLHNGESSMFYVDNMMGFECGSRLPEHIRKEISRLHRGEEFQSPPSFH